MNALQPRMYRVLLIFSAHGQGVFHRRAKLFELSFFLRKTFLYRISHQPCKIILTASHVAQCTPLNETWIYFLKLFKLFVFLCCFISPKTDLRLTSQRKNCHLHLKVNCTLNLWNILCYFCFLCFVFCVDLTLIKKTTLVTLASVLFHCFKYFVLIILISNFLSCRFLAPTSFAEFQELIDGW